MKVLLVVLALGLLAVWAADAQLVSNALGSHMVLQRVHTRYTTSSLTPSCASPR
jgi:hypothetical protein